MAKFSYFVLIAILCYMNVTMARPSPDEERYVDKEYNRELVNWLNSIQYGPQQFGSICKYPYYYGNVLTSPIMPKRNSELINSLLSLPKNMNDAGK